MIIRKLARDLQQEGAVARLVRGICVMSALALLAACASLFTHGPPAPHVFTLDAPTPTAGSSNGASIVLANASVIIVTAPRAEPGFDSEAIVYVSEAHRLQAYSDSQWIGPPSKMLEPLISAALVRTGVFGAVMPMPGAVDAQWELRSEVVRLQLEVADARFRFTLRVTLIDKQTRRVVLAREFDATAPVDHMYPAGAVPAANVVVADVLRQVATACALEVERRR
jgi:cholesterol transport system auxiliary component